MCAAPAFRKGERDSRRLVELARDAMSDVDHLQYLQLADATTLEPVTGPVERPAALCVAAALGTTRLIDNVLLIPPPMALSDHELELVSHAIGRKATAAATGPQPS